MATIPLGTKARDTVTGFVGMCVERIEYISGYTRVGLQPDNTGQPIWAPEYFDEPRCSPYAPPPLRPHQPQP